MGRVVGIDLGTTFSVIAVVNRHGGAEIIANREGERITPSVVLFDGDTPLVGSMAKRLAVAHPENMVQFVKRQMGNPSWKFPNENGVYTPEEVSALIIKRFELDSFPFVQIKDVCSHSLGVITHDEFERPHNTIVLRRQTPYGAKVSEIFSTLADWQTAIDVQVTEGEEEILEQVEIIGRQEVKIPPYPKGAPVEVFFQWNLDGMVHITVFDLTANTPLSEIHFKRLSNLSEQQVSEKADRLTRTAVG